MNLWIPKNRAELKQHLNDPLFKNSYFLMANTFVSAASGFFFWIIAARLYSAEEVGLGSALLAATGLLGILSMLGFDVALIRYLPGEKDKSGMINSCLTITACIALVLALLFLLGLNIWAPALITLRENIIFATIFILFTIAGSLSLMQNYVFVAFRQTEYSFAQTLVTVLRIGILPFLITLGAFGVYSSAGLASLLALIAGNILILKVHSAYLPIPVVKKRMVNDMLHYSFGNYVANIFSGLPASILPLLVINVLSSTMNAYFYVAWSISGILLIIPLATSKSLFAEGSFSPERLRKDVNRSLKFIFILLSPPIIFIFIFGRYALMLFGTEYAQNSFELLLILSVAIIPYSVNVVYVSVKRVKNEVIPVILVYGTAALFTIAGGYLLMQSMGLIGIGIAWVMANIFAAIFIGFISFPIHR